LKFKTEIYVESPFTYTLVYTLTTINYLYPVYYNICIGFNFVQFLREWK